MNKSYESWLVNPYCSKCYEKRTKQSSESKLTNWHIEGHYIVFNKDEKIN